MLLPLTPLKVSVEFLKYIAPLSEAGRGISDDLRPVIGGRAWFSKNRTPGMPLVAPLAGALKVTFG